MSQFILTCLYTFFFFFFGLLRAVSMAYGSSQAWGQIGAAAASLHHNLSNVGSKPHLRSIPHLTAVPDPQPTEQGQGSNPYLHGWILVRFITAEPRPEFHAFILF